MVFHERECGCEEIRFITKIIYGLQKIKCCRTRIYWLEHPSKKKKLDLNQMDDQSGKIPLSSACIFNTSAESFGMKTASAIHRLIEIVLGDLKCTVLPA